MSHVEALLAAIGCILVGAQWGRMVAWLKRLLEGEADVADELAALERLNHPARGGHPIRLPGQDH